MRTSEVTVEIKMRPVAVFHILLLTIAAHCGEDESALEARTFVNATSTIVQIDLGIDGVANFTLQPFDTTSVEGICTYTRGDLVSCNIGWDTNLDVRLTFDDSLRLDQLATGDEDVRYLGAMFPLYQRGYTLINRSGDPLNHAYTIDSTDLNAAEPF